uniref:Class II aldolase/adducin N-terminal domain-containing protein n=1 Tax=Ornithorhynchus anatinus TaxID=9258 RepID=A0A6I8PH29_ORNAN
MSGEDPGPEEASSPPPPPPAGHRPLDHRFSEDARDYLRLRNTAAGLRQDFNMMEQKKRVTMVLQSPSFREELESLIQEQTKKGRSSHIWALRQIADFMATSAGPRPLSVPPLGPSTVAPINDLQGSDAPALAKGERLLRCKLAGLHRLLDLHGWAALGHAYVTVSLRVNKEQGHFLVRPQGLACARVTAAALVKVNIVGEVVDRQRRQRRCPVDSVDFRLHAAIYAARPDVRCVIHLHTPATAAVSAMKCGLLAASHDALLVGDAKCLGPTCKMVVLRNHGILALGATVEEAFYNIFHAQAACEIQVGPAAQRGGCGQPDRAGAGAVPAPAGGGRALGRDHLRPMQKSRLGEHEFEALMRMLDNLVRADRGRRPGAGLETGTRRARPHGRREAPSESPAAVTAFLFEEEEEGASGAGAARCCRPTPTSQQKEKTRWLNTPNTYLRVEPPGRGPARHGQPPAEEADRAGSGTPIRIENPNQFVPLYTDPQEVLEMRNKIREQNRQEVKSAGPQSQLLASVISDDSRSPVGPPTADGRTDGRARGDPQGAGRSPPLAQGSSRRGDPIGLCQALSTVLCAPSVSPQPSPAAVAPNPSPPPAPSSTAPLPCADRSPRPAPDLAQPSPSSPVRVEHLLCAEHWTEHSGECDRVGRREELQAPGCRAPC